MKTLRVWIVIAIVLLTFLSIQTNASTEPGRRDSSGQVTESEEARIITSRLAEINAMDRSNLSDSEIEDLKKEVKASKKRMKQISGGTFSSYFSELVNRFAVAMRL